MADPAPDPPPRRRVARGEGEVTQWPRGVVGYVSSGPEDATPSPDEDRVANRLELAARLLDVLETQGRAVDALRVRLADARAALEAGDRGRAHELGERLLGDIGTVAGEREPTRP